MCEIRRRMCSLISQSRCTRNALDASRSKDYEAEYRDLQRLLQREVTLGELGTERFGVSWSNVQKSIQRPLVVYPSLLQKEVR